MMIHPRMAVAGLALSVALRPAVAQPTAADSGVRIDAVTRVGRLWEGGRITQFTSGQAIRVSKGRKHPIRIAGLNSALFTCSAAQEAVADPDRGALLTWLKGLGPYLPLLAGPPGVQPHTATDLERAAVEDRDELEKALEALDSIVSGPAGAMSIRFLQLKAIDGLVQTGHDGSVELVTDTYVRARPQPCADGGCPAPASLMAALSRVQDVAQRVRAGTPRRDSIIAVVLRDTTARAVAIRELSDVLRALRHPAARAGLLDSMATLTELQANEVLGVRAVVVQSKAIDALLEAAAAAVAETDNLRALVRSVHRWDRRIRQAARTLDCGSVQVAGDSGRKVTLTVAPLKEPELAGVELEAQGFTFGFSATANRGVRFGAGLALLYAPAASFPGYGASEVNGQAVVIEKGVQDFRVNYGLTLGVALGQPAPSGKAGLRWWPIEGTLVPSDNVRAFALGTAVSFGLVKVGVGKVWARHEVLAAANPLGAALPSADALRTTPSFREPKFYVSLSLVGLPPFVPE